MFLSDFDFYLPEDLIAQLPSDERSSSRLLVLNRDSGKITHSVFSDLPSFLRSGDLLVFNDAKVIPARIFFVRESGARVEFLLSSRCDENTWLAICNKMKKMRDGEILSAENDDSVKIKIIGREGDHVRIETLTSFDEAVLDRIGRIPLPPYIRRAPDSSDARRYQTVYSKVPGAVAAPTAGLHFTDEILARIKEMGVNSVFVTLDVSWGTFSPVRSETVEAHVMHCEKYDLSQEAADIINSTRSSGKRIIAVGTTSIRVLESTFHDGRNVAGRGETSIFIHPPMRIKSADCLITNFHTPKSTLLMLVSAFAGYDVIKKTYAEAVERGYRFFSYGDSMFIEGK